MQRGSIRTRKWSLKIVKLNHSSYASWLKDFFFLLSFQFFTLESFCASFLHLGHCFWSLPLLSSSLKLRHDHQFPFMHLVNVPSTLCLGCGLLQLQVDPYAKPLLCRGQAQHASCMGLSGEPQNLVLPMLHPLQSILPRWCGPYSTTLKSYFPMVLTTQLRPHIHINFVMGLFSD